jgi:hypothetical protein
MITQCENTVSDLGAYFLQGRRVPVRCARDAAWVVSVNPPTKDSDGNVRLCDSCNALDYRTFPREKIASKAGCVP